jgi:uncharacterized protein
VKPIVAALFLSLPAWAELPKPIVADKVQDRFVPAPYETQKMDGFLAERMRVNLQGRLLHVDEPELLDGFQHRPGKHPWIGEHVGKFLDAGANTWLYTHDARLKTLMDRMARALIATQLADGYLGTYSDDQRWTSWDVWVHKYDLIGLLSYYRVTGFGPALDSARKVGDLLVRTFGDKPGQRDIIAAGTHVGMAATSVLEPVCMLYRYTGDKRYLDFAYYIVRAWDQPNGPKIIASILETGSVYKTANAKAYEMMSNLVGLVDLYRLTGEDRFLKTAQTAWNDIATRRLYVTGTTSSKEHFTDDDSLPGEVPSNVGEGCATVTWLQLSWQLLRVTSEQKYADEIERSVFNQLLGAQDPSNGNICYFTPLNGQKNPTPGINCCVSSEPRGISMIPQFTWGEKDGGIAVLLYAPGFVQIGTTRLTSETTFPESGSVTLTVEVPQKSRFPLYLRVPYWTTGYSVRAGGKLYSGKAGEFVTLDREWTTGDTVVIDMDMTVRVISGGRTYPGYEAIQRGPQVLALDQGANPDVEWLHEAAPRDVKLKPAGAFRYRLDGEVVGHDLHKQEEPLTLVPFTEATNYRVWMPKPETLSTDVSVTAFGKESASRRGTVEDSICDIRADTYRNTARGKASGDDWFAVELNRPEEISRVVFRHGKSTAQGGWFEGKPQIQVKRSAEGDWQTVAELSSYEGGPSLKDGQAFEAKLAAPIRVVAIRVTGKPAREFVSCAELAAYMR